MQGVQVKKIGPRIAVIKVADVLRSYMIKIAVKITTEHGIVWRKNRAGLCNPNLRLALLC